MLENPHISANGWGQAMGRRGLARSLRHTAVLAAIATSLFAAAITSHASGQTLTGFPILAANSGAVGMAAGPDDNQWFTENSANKIGHITTGCPSFDGVPPGDPFYAFIRTVARGGIAAAAGNYCPNNPVTRAQMAVFLLEVEHGSTYTPPACTPPGIFGDVSCPGGFAVDWIEQLYNEGITGGCSASPLLYCPDQAVTRAQMAVFLLRAQHGPGYLPPACIGIFQDVPCTPTGDATVTVGNNSFSPSTVAITAGSTVTWNWNSGVVLHSTTSGACSPNCMPDGRWDSGLHMSPNTFSFTFTSAGTFPYYCGFHLASMTGTVQVGSPAFAVDWIEQLYTEGTTGGCSASPPLYCPDQAVTRAQMAVFLLRAKYGPSYTPPACTPPGIFGDVACPGDFAVDWIEQLYSEGITGGCGSSPPPPPPYFSSLLDSSDNPDTRARMGVLFVKAFGR